MARQQEDNQRGIRTYSRVPPQHDSGPGIIRCGDMPQSTKSDKLENILEQLYSLSERQLHQFIHLVSAAQLLGDLPQFEAVHHSVQKSNEQA